MFKGILGYIKFVIDNIMHEPIKYAVDDIVAWLTGEVDLSGFANYRLGDYLEW